MATIARTTSENYLSANNIRALTFSSADEAYQALLDETVDAVVYDAPVLRYYSSHAGLGRVSVVDPVFQAEDYGFVFRNGSELRRDVDAALLSMRQDGTYQQLREQWFGKL